MTASQWRHEADGWQTSFGTQKNAELTSIAANSQTSDQPSRHYLIWHLVAAERQSTEIDQCRWLMIIYILYYRMIRESAKTTREAESNSVQVISHQTTTKIIVELCWASARGEQGWCTHIQLQMHGKAAACANCSCALDEVAQKNSWTAATVTWQWVRESDMPWLSLTQGDALEESQCICMYAVCCSIRLNMFGSKFDEIYIYMSYFAIFCHSLSYFVQWLSKRVISELPNGSSGDVADLIRVRLLAGWMKRFHRYTDRICRVYRGAVHFFHV